MNDTAYPAAASPRPDLTALLFQPNVSINGSITQDTVLFFLDRLQVIRSGAQDLIMEIDTDGGDADAARRIALELRLFQRHSGHAAYCVGKTRVYSAGVTIFAAFPREHRFLTEDAVLLVHERRLQKAIDLSGPMKSNIQIVREQLALLETAEQLEMQGFEELVRGSALTVDLLYERALNNCYIHADEACRLGLVADILR